MELFYGNDNLLVNDEIIHAHIDNNEKILKDFLRSTYIISIICKYLCSNKYIFVYAFIFLSYLLLFYS